MLDKKKLFFYKIKSKETKKVRIKLHGYTATPCPPGGVVVVVVEVADIVALVESAEFTNIVAVVVDIPIGGEFGGITILLGEAGIPIGVANVPLEFVCTSIGEANKTKSIMKTVIINWRVIFVLSRNDILNDFILIENEFMLKRYL